MKQVFPKIKRSLYQGTRQFAFVLVLLATFVSLAFAEVDLSSLPDGITAGDKQRVYSSVLGNQAAIALQTRLFEVESKLFGWHPTKLPDTSIDQIEAAIQELQQELAKKSATANQFNGFDSESLNIQLTRLANQARIAKAIVGDSGSAGIGASINPSPYAAQTNAFSAKIRDLYLTKHGDKAEMASLAYKYEFELANLLLEMENDTSLKKADKVVLTAGVMKQFEKTRFLHENMFEDMIRLVSINLGGTDGGQFRKVVNGEVLYDCNYRLDDPIPPAEQLKLYTKKLDDFQKAGGSLTEIAPLTRDRAKSFKNFTFMEFAYLADGTLNVTEGKAGHILLAKGQAVRSAGQIVLLRSNDGKIVAAMLSNGSGSYKPDMASLTAVGKELERILGIPQDKIFYTKGEPMSTQIAKLYMKALKLDKDKSALAVKSLEEDAAKVLPRTKIDKDLPMGYVRGILNCIPILGALPGRN